VLGRVGFGWRAPRPFSADDLDYLRAVASHAAIALHRSRLLAATQQVAETLQRALLPRVISSIPGWDLAACYTPAVEGTQVGGDRYDAFALPGDRVGLVERRDVDPSVWLGALAEAAQDLPDTEDLQSAARGLIDRLAAPGRTIDDIAILGLRRAAHR
jgi:serine phosphatase RsbU (regulator of sigma subunit)